MTTHHTTREPVTNETGSAVLYFLIAIAFVGMLMFALVADGSRILAGLSDTSDIAQIAARTAAREVDPSTGRLDTYHATTAAQAELAAADMTGTITVTPTTVTVTATTTLDLPLLAIVGIDRHTVTSTRNANLLDQVGPP